jgi:hypothetical protein
MGTKHHIKKLWQVPTTQMLLGCSWTKTMELENLHLVTCDAI